MNLRTIRRGAVALAIALAPAFAAASADVDEAGLWASPADSSQYYPLIGVARGMQGPLDQAEFRLGLGGCLVGPFDFTMTMPSGEIASIYRLEAGVSYPEGCNTR